MVISYAKVLPQKKKIKQKAMLNKGRLRYQRVETGKLKLSFQSFSES